MPRLDYYGESGDSPALAVPDTVFNVSSYGWVGDGTTDERAAFNLATAAATAAGGGEIILPANTGAISSGSLLIPSNVIVRGIHGKSVLKTTWVASTSIQLIECTGVSNVTFIDVTFDGNQTSLSNFLNVVQVYNSQNISFIRCRFQNMKGIALLASTNIRNLQIVDCEFINCGRYPTFGGGGGRQAIAFTDSVLGNSYDNIVTGCYFSNIGLDCISVDMQTRFTASANRGTTTGAALVYVTRSTGTVISGNMARTGATGSSPYANGIDLFQTANVSITGNLMYECGGCGIGVFDSDGVSVSGNFCLNNNQDAASTHRGGIVVNTGSTHVTVSGNTCTDTQSTKTQQYGIVVDPTNVNVVVGLDNDFRGNLDGDMSSTDYAANAALETAVTYLVPYYSVNGTTPGLGVRGSATDIDVQVTPKGTGGFDVSTGALKMGATIVINSSRHPVLRSYAKASLPSAATAAQLIYVTDDVGGATPAFSDGASWRRVADRAVIA